MTSRLTFRQLMGESAGEDAASPSADESDPRKGPPRQAEPEEGREDSRAMARKRPRRVATTPASTESFSELMGESKAEVEGLGQGGGGKRTPGAEEPAAAELNRRIDAAAIALTDAARPPSEEASMSALMAPETKSEATLGGPAVEPDPTRLAELLEAEVRKRLETGAEPGGAEVQKVGAGRLLRQEGGGVNARAADCPPWLLAALMRGACPPAMEVDLHGFAAAAVEERLGETLSQASQRRVLCVRVVCGRGLHSGIVGAVLPAVCEEYLMGRIEAGRVLAFCTAPARFGGQGAFLVRLRRRD